MSMEKTCKITNRSVGIVAYNLPDRHLLRQFHPRETKTVMISEIEEVSNQAGGRELLYNYFYIDPPSILNDVLNIKPETEYFSITEDNIDQWLQNSSLEEFQDALDFAPDGIKELIKLHSVKLPLNDLRKCESIKKQLNFDVLAAIKNEKATVEDIDQDNIPNTRRRAAQSQQQTEPQKTGRRATNK